MFEFSRQKKNQSENSYPNVLGSTFVPFAINGEFVGLFLSLFPPTWPVWPNRQIPRHSANFLLRVSRWLLSSVADSILLPKKQDLLKEACRQWYYLCLNLKSRKQARQFTVQLEWSFLFFLNRELSGASGASFRI